MARITYRYNPEACKYEPDFANSKKVLKGMFTFLSIALTMAVAAFAFFRKEAESISGQWLEKKNNSLKTEWKILEQRISHSSNQLNDLIEKDDHNYRVILDSQPLQASIREAGIGGSEKINTRELKAFPAIYSDYKRVDKLKHQLDIEMQSFRQIEKLLDEKLKMWSSRPAIQPIDNRQLDKLHLTFGLRMHPIFKVMMLHKGLDFTASEGTPVYATGDGKVTMVYLSESYGRVIFVDHGHGFETRYAHLSKFNVTHGQQVKRGQVIGFVGSTGHSVSSHLHYEVLYNGQQINPINFFQRDLSNKEYEKLIQVGSQNSDPLD